MKKKYVLIITLFPLILAVSIGLSLLLYVRDKGPQTTPLEGEVTLEEVEATLDKLYNYVGKRDMETEAGRKNLRSAAAMFEGSLGPENLGYQVHRSEGEVSAGLIWPMYWIDLGEKKAGKTNVLAIAQDDEGVALALGMHFSEYVAGRWNGAHTKVVLYPPMMNGPDEEKIWQTLGISEAQRGELISLILGDGGEETPALSTEQVRVALKDERAGSDQAEVIMDLLPKLENLLK